MDARTRNFFRFSVDGRNRVRECEATLTAAHGLAGLPIPCKAQVPESDLMLCPACSLAGSAVKTMIMDYPKRIPCLDGLRGIAALAVGLYHFNGFFLPQARLPHLERGYLAVDLLFFS